MPTIYNVLDGKRELLIAFSGAVLRVTQKYLSTSFNSGVLFLPRAFVAFCATDFTPTMMAVGSLFMLKKQI
jgi:hypothetical protein